MADRTNASLEFSQHGNTTVNGSAQTHIEGVQLTASSTTNGSTTIGFNYNVNNEGPRRGSNLSVNYDTDNGQLSGSLGYTNPDYGIGGTLNLDANGVSLSTQYNGNNVSTVTNNGFQYDQFNWAQNNINVAQDMTGDAERAKAAEAKASKDRELLIKNGVKLEDFAKLPPEIQSEVIHGLTIHEENQNLFESQRDKIDNNPNLSEEQKNAALHQLANDIENLSPQLRQAALNEMNHVMTVDQMAANTLALLGSSAALFGFLGFSGNGTGQIPTNINANGPVVARRPEDGEVDHSEDAERSGRSREDGEVIDNTRDYELVDTEFTDEERGAQYSEMNEAERYLDGEKGGGNFEVGPTKLTSAEIKEMNEYADKYTKKLIDGSATKEQIEKLHKVFNRFNELGIPHIGMDGEPLNPQKPKKSIPPESQRINSKPGDFKLERWISKTGEEYVRPAKGQKKGEFWLPDGSRHEIKDTENMKEFEDFWEKNKPKNNIADKLLNDPYEKKKNKRNPIQPVNPPPSVPPTR